MFDSLLSKILVVDCNFNSSETVDMHCLQSYTQRNLLH